MDLFYNYCRSKQLRPKTMQTYRQGLQLFELWLKGQGIVDVTEICEMTIREYILNLQERGKYAYSIWNEKYVRNNNKIISQMQSPPSAHASSGYCA